MSEANRSNWLLVGKRFAIAFLVAMALGLLAYFGSGPVPEEHHLRILLVGAASLWCICAGAALRRLPLLDLVAVSAGLTWGFLFSLSAAISIKNGGDSVFWPAMIPVLLLTPFAATTSVLPFWLFAKRWNNAR